MARQAINSPEYKVPLDGFSHIITAPPGLAPLYVSGLTSRRGDGEIVAVGDMRGQARQVMENMRNVLFAANATLDDVVQIRTFVTDITEWDAIEEVWREYWGDHWPASTLVQIERLYDERQMIEMEAVALVEPSSYPGAT